MKYERYADKVYLRRTSDEYSDKKSLSRANKRTSDVFIDKKYLGRA